MMSWTLRTAFAFAALTLLSGPIAAMSWSRPTPHKVELAICEAHRITGFLNAYGRSLEDPDSDLPDGMIDIAEIRPQVGDDMDFSADQDEKFTEYMRISDGKSDKGNLELVRLVQITKDKIHPVYLIQFRRTRWIHMTLLDDPTVDLSEYQTVTNTWIMSFAGMRFTGLREADELEKLAKSKPNLLKRKVDCAAFYKSLKA